VVFGRKIAQHNHTQQMVNELGHSAVHLRRAAGHLAVGTAERLTPTYAKARHVADKSWISTRETINPIYQQMREGAMNSRTMKQLGKDRMKMGSARMKQMAKKSGKGHGSRWGGLSGLLIAGAAVGAASAVVARRRRAMQAEWDEYEPMAGFDESRYAESQYGQKPTGAKVASGAATMADNLSARAGRIADSLHERSANMQDKSMEGPQSGAHAAPMGMPSRTTGPSGDFAGPPSGSNMPGPGMGTPSGPMAGNRDRLGDPALDFPDER
jgi:hypothetical protein